MDKINKARINGLFLIITLVINAFGALGWINGLSQKEISNRYLTLITPSPSTFGIWSVIYSLLLVSVVVMIVKKDDVYYHNVIDQVTVLFRVSCLFNIAWIISFSYVQIELSVFFILGLVITLSLICNILRRVQTGKHWLLPLTFGMYTGWLMIATVVNIAAALVKLNWNGFGIAHEIWAAIVLVISVVFSFFVLQKNRNAIFPLPIAWAYFGIYQFLTAPEGFGGKYGLLQVISLAGMVVLIGIASIQLYINHFALLPDSAERK